MEDFLHFYGRKLCVFCFINWDFRTLYLLPKLMRDILFTTVLCSRCRCWLYISSQHQSPPKWNSSVFSPKRVLILLCQPWKKVGWNLKYFWNSLVLFLQHISSNHFSPSRVYISIYTIYIYILVLHREKWSGSTGLKTRAPHRSRGVDGTPPNSSPMHVWLLLLAWVFKAGPTPDWLDTRNQFNFGHGG